MTAPTIQEKAPIRYIATERTDPGGRRVWDICRADTGTVICWTDDRAAVVALLRRHTPLGAGS